MPWRLYGRLTLQVAAVAVIGLLLVLLLFQVVRTSEAKGLVAQVKAGETPPAPRLELPRLDGGGTVSLGDLRGKKAVVLNFWASWCDPCRREMPLFERVWRGYKDRGVVILGVDVRDAPRSAREFVSDFGITYPIVRDEEARLAERLGVDPLPQTFFVDHRGRLAGDQVLGEITRAELERRIDALLAAAEAA
jgi:peroxiredoxin